MEFHYPQDAVCLTKTPQERSFQIGDPAESPVFILLPADSLKPQQNLHGRNHFAVLNDLSNGP
jgi:hypothetical protein